MKHGHFLAFFSIVRVLFRQWGDFLDFGEGIDFGGIDLIHRTVRMRNDNARATVADSDIATIARNASERIG